MDIAVAPPDPQHLLQASAAAVERDDLPVALELLAELRARFGHIVGGYVRAAEILRRLGRLDEADAVLADGIAALPDEPAIAIAAAQVADQRGDRDRAVARWTVARTRFAGSSSAIVGLAQALRRAGRSDEADAQIADAAPRFPGDRKVLIEFGHILQARGDWVAAIAQWEKVRALAPDMTIGWVGTMHALRELGWLGVAEAWLDAAIARFPDDHQFTVERAKLAVARGDWDAGAALWERVRKIYPQRVSGYVGGAACLRELYRADAADALLAEATARFPGDAAVAVEVARIAQHARQWGDAVARWERVRKLSPRLAEAYVSGAACLRALGRLDAAEALLTEATGKLPDDAAIVTALASILAAREQAGQADANPECLVADASRTQVVMVMGEAEQIASAARLPPLDGAAFAYAVSLGTHCFPSARMKEIGLKRFSLPFDWADATIDWLLDCLSSDCQRLLDRSRFRAYVNALGQREVYHDYREFAQPAQFPHFDPMTDTGFAYLQRCVERLRGLFELPAPKLFYMVVRRVQNPDPARFTARFRTLCRTIETLTANARVVGIVTDVAPAEIGFSELWLGGPHAIYRYASGSSLGGTAFADRADTRRVDKFLHRLVLTGVASLDPQG